MVIKNKEMTQLPGWSSPTLPNEKHGSGAVANVKGLGVNMASQLMVSIGQDA